MGPTNWINQDQPTLIPHARDIYYTHSIPLHTEKFYEPQPVDKSADKPSRLNSLPSSLTNSAVAHMSSAKVTYIPGLPPNSLVNTPKKSQKRRKKKKKTESLIEHRGSTSSESEIQKFSTAEECISTHVDNEVNSEQNSEKFVPEVAAEPIHEIHLTDDLADSLVNPPTDPECDDPSLSITKNEEKFNEKNSSIETNVVVKTSNNELNIVMKYDKIELEDKEDDEITEKIKDNVSVKVFSEANQYISNVDKQKNDSERDIITNITNIPPEKEIVESKENSVECVSLPDNLLKAIDEQSESFDEPIKTECAMKVEEYLSDDNALKTDQEKVPGLEKCNKKFKNRNRKPKKGVKSVLSSDFDTEVEISNRENISIENNSPAEVKKSYSSVIKSNLVKSSGINNTITSLPKVETVPISSPHPTILSCPDVQTKTKKE